MTTIRCGKLAGTESVLEVRCSSTIDLVDELIAPASTDEYIAPGFIDLQVNGFAGVDYNDPSTSQESIRNSIRTMFKTGVTRFFPTLITGSFERITGALKNLAAAKANLDELGLPSAMAIEGFHVEGPHISPADGPRGAHPKEHVRPPDVEEFKLWQEAAGGLVKLVTVSPEWEGTPKYVEALTRQGVVVSIGHTRATPEQVEAAVDAGATMSTHLGNGAHPILPTKSSYIWSQLAEDRLTASFIVDGIHIPGPFLKSALRAKGLEHSVLVTDAVMPAMCEPGPYNLGQVEVDLHEDGSVRLRGGTRLAGSALSMDRAIGTTVRLAGVSLRDAITMATINAARAGRINGRLRGINTGERADLVRFRWDEAAQKLSVLETIVGGVSVYDAELKEAA
jgi:N-acetylglucosamine-6-phosphate deacetylase